MKMLPLVAIVGRPNVGKSTFFNRLVGKKQAIVYDQPGVTRDRNFGLADWAGLAFQVVDTGGYEADPSSDLFAQMRRQVEQAIREAQVVMLLVDARAGLTPDDEAMAERLRKADKKVFLIANKIDHEKNDASLGEFFKLGFDQIYPISAEHGRGVADLLDELKIELEKDLQEEPAAEEDRAIRVAIIGRPNVGKSTLINRLFGAPRAVVHPEPGTTRDPLDIEMTHEDQRYVFVDTAGIRKKSHSEGKIEKVSVLKSFETIEKSHVVLLVVDATIGLTAQDGKVAQHAFERHRPMIFLVNKWDLMSEKNWADFVKDIETRFDFLRFVPILKLSAKAGLGVERVFRE
ncbi:MAG: ribosome biogenesis GTPase Der, partial [Deltaproteobacteria bacterium]|nr:ribosome biogenesis GTPase Der [Deltaproteobacteria bacterium]